MGSGGSCVLTYTDDELATLRRLFPPFSSENSLMPSHADAPNNTLPDHPPPKASTKVSIGGTKDPPAVPFVDEGRDGWKVVRVFVSSTFADFFHEREILVKYVFPRLRAWCLERKLTLIEVDLRWGVPADSTSEVILRACLEEIDRCKEVNRNPFFLNMISHRYGWVPKKSEVPDSVGTQYSWIDGASVTLMEIMCGAYRNSNPNALFAIRDETFLHNLPSSFVSYFHDKSWMSKVCLDGMKHFIRDRFSAANQVFDYNVTPERIDSSTGLNKVVFRNLQPFADRVLQFFQNAIERQYPLKEIAPESPYEAIAHQLSLPHVMFSRAITNVVVGRKAQFQRMQEWLAKPSRKNILLLAGNPSCGKSTILAASENLTKLGHKVIFHSSQSDESPMADETRDIIYLMCRICLELGSPTIQNETLSYYGERQSREEGQGYHAIREIMVNMFQSHLFNSHATPSNPAVVLLDEAYTFVSFESNVHESAAKLLSSLCFPLPDNIRFIISSDNHDFLLSIAQQSEAGAPPEPPPPSDSDADAELQRQSEIIVCASSNDSLTQSLSSRDFIALPPLERDELAEMVTQTLGAYNKKLSPVQMDLLLQNPGSTNLPWLVTACEELRIFGVFETITAHIRELPPTMPELVALQLRRIELVTLSSPDTARRVRNTLLLIDASIKGLEENELRELLFVKLFPEDDGVSVIDFQPLRGSEGQCTMIPYVQWSEICFWIKPFVMLVPAALAKGKMRYVIRNKVVKEAVNTFFNEGQSAIPPLPSIYYQRALASYFKNYPDTNRLIEEYPMQLIACKDVKEIKEFVISSQFAGTPYTAALTLVSMIRCRNILPVLEAQKPRPEVMCIGCSMKCTFNSKRMNRSACCVCGKIIHSTMALQSNKVTLRLFASERVGMMCRTHNMQAYTNTVAKVVKCFVCKCMQSSDGLLFNVVMCTTCSSGTQKCCFTLS